jgi:16S rRNA (adenine1518-N6/adenine1519-N6)-dimethyltransferase
MSARRPVNAARRHPRPRKAPLGQNFLRDSNAARRIVEALGDIRDSVVIEIGAGSGALTDLLATRAGHLIAVELDEMLAERLRMARAEQPNLTIVRANFLELSIRDLLEALAGSSAAKCCIVGNIPYYITSDILLHLFQYAMSIDVAVLMVQKEVADRLTADPGSRDYGLLSVTARLFSDVERLFTLPPSAFSPPPKVHSSVLRLRMNPKAAKLGLEANDFLNFCKLAFGEKRKTIFNNLRKRYPGENVRQAIASLELRDDARAETLSLEQLVGVYRLLREATGGQH